MLTQPSPSAPTPSPASGAVVNAYSVAADPGYDVALSLSSISTRVWRTDFRFHTIPYDEVFSGGVRRDGIPPIDNPQFIDIAQADEWLTDMQPVIALEVGGEAKAYPLQVLTRHEIVNDEIAGVPVTVTYCPLCNSAVVFERTLDGTVYDFGVSGNLRNSDLIMWDRQTESWWQQLTGEGIVGDLAGAQLAFIPAQVVSWTAFRDAHPTGLVLAEPVAGRYGANPYPFYDTPDEQPFLFLDPATQLYAQADPRLLPKERVAAVEVNGESVAFPYTRLAEERVIHYQIGGQEIVVFFEFGTNTALGAIDIATAADVGATGVFNPVSEGQSLTFRPADDSSGGGFVDNETGSTWSILGRALTGPLAGRQLERYVAQDHLWFAWAAFKPDTQVYAGIS